MTNNIFAAPIATAAPPSQINIRSDHPVPRKGIAQPSPIQTNKFYANLFLGDQTCPAYVHPYSVSWSAGRGATGSYGMAISHVEPEQRVYGPTNSAGAAQYFINPVGIQSLVLSAQELGDKTTIMMDSATAFSTRVHLLRNNQSTPDISFPLVQGMGYVTALYNGSTPVINTGVYFRTVTRVLQDPKTDVAKFTLTLEDGKVWRMYAYRTKGDQLDLQVVNNGFATAKGPFYGAIQVCKDPGTGEAMYDQGAGVYPTGLELTGDANGSQGTYNFNFKRAGHSNGTLVMYALPHHQQSFDAATSANMTATQLQTTTKGLATAVIADSWTMVEPNMPIGMGFAPWSDTVSSLNTLSDAAKATIQAVATKEVSQDMIAQTNLDSMYFSGKALCKFALILYVINDMLGDKPLAMAGLGQLKQAFATFAANKQQFPLVYERAWGGVVSSATYVTGNDGVDFGNTYYNDHHFHYGYFILTAAVIGHIDPTWLAANKDYVNTLVRDVANPSSQDPYFPVYRSFDWYHGHSWAHGLYATLDGKDQESSSEDMMHAYAIKMWGTVLGDGNMTARGNLQLAITARSIQNYYLYTNTNTIQPAQFIANRVAGILFENKCDHTTYFGTNIEYIQGIHMIPLLPSSPFVRRPDFVGQEWDTYFSNGRAEAVQGGWKGILFGNYATINAAAAYAFFNSSSFSSDWIDGGASLTWYLAYAAARGGG